MGRRSPAGGPAAARAEAAGAAADAAVAAAEEGACDAAARTDGYIVSCQYNSNNTNKSSSP